MDYAVDRKSLTGLIEEEVSRVAASEYSDGGVSLYDSIAVSSRDADAVSRLIDSALESVVSRVPDICDWSGAPADVLSFSVEDLPNALVPSVEAVLDDYIVFHVCTSWLASRATDRSAEYAARRDALLSDAVRLLRTRRRAAR